MPPGRHLATHEEIRERFVFPDKDGLLDAFWDTPSRRDLFAGYERLIEALKIAELPAEQWIGGSFVSLVMTPHDIDMVNYCDAKVYESLSAEVRAMLKQYFLGRETAKHCHCDSHFAVLPPATHRHLEDFKIVQAYWEKTLGHDRTGMPKGIIERYVDAKITSDNQYETEELSDAILG